MITLREFLKMIRDEQYRIYQPNRDCLIFESYYTVHSPFYFEDEKESALATKEEYWNNNDYCRGVYTDAYKDPAYDEETAAFLNKYGHYEVNYVEISSWMPTRLYKDENGELKIEHMKDPRDPYRDYVPCFNIFINSYDSDHSWCCNYCKHGLLKSDPDDRNGYSRFPDPKDVECKTCWRFLENNSKGVRGK